MRDKILKIVQRVTPFDEIEKNHVLDTIQWIKNGAELFRIQKPDIPSKHLVSYFIIIDKSQGKMLLVDHIRAQLWLPTGGHVMMNEDPKKTVEREIIEELNIRASFIFKEPFFLTQAITVGLTAGHTDVSFWYVLKGDLTIPLKYDTGEFNSYKWFSYSEVLAMPIERLDPNTHRFVRKWISINHK